MSSYPPPPPPPNQGPPGVPPPSNPPPQGPPPGGPQHPGPPGGPPDYVGGPPPSGGGGISGKLIAIVVAAVLVLAGGGVAAALLLSGDDDGGGGDVDNASDSASVEDFCDGLNAFDEEIDVDGDPQDQVDKAHELADELAEIGTPEGIPDDAREGFELYVEAIGEIDADDVEDFENIQGEDQLAEVLGLDEDELDQVEAFFGYVGEQCFDVPTDGLPTDVPTDDLPTDFPTDGFPTDFTIPTDFTLPSDFTIPTDFLSDFTLPTE